MILDLDVNFDQPGSVNSSHEHGCMEQLPEAVSTASRYLLSLSKC